MSLQIYRRHRDKCPRSQDRVSKKCRCALWATGTVEGKPFRKSLKTKSFDRAVRLVEKIENGTPAVAKPKGKTIKESFEEYLNDCIGRKLSHATLHKYRCLRRTVEQFCDKESIIRLTDLTIEALRKFREQRKVSARTAAKELERLRAYFTFCVNNAWLEKNPARALKAPEVKPNPTLPFTSAQVESILKNTDFRSNVFFRVLLHSGLRIIDASALTPEKIVNGKLFLYTQKTGTPVSVPLPPDLIADLANVRLVGGYYFMVECENPVVIAEYYRRKLAKAAKVSGIKKANPHRFRDTFATNLLVKGVSIETVAILLGNTVRVCERHYSPWVLERQSALERAVELTWQLKAAPANAEAAA